ncbi:MAG: hypothetical protein Ta2D_10090 [Rickettsiales bacterium]|nr:MAG: hypothetical protein Ta2D_10090 [Rickettsiales bacterium]
MIYCAFIKQLWGGGKDCKWTMKMPDVCALFEKNGLKNCKVVTTSGNIIFDSNKKIAELNKITRGILETFYSARIDVFVKSREEIANICKDFPYTIEKGFYYNLFLLNIENYSQIIMEQFKKFSPLEDEEMFIKDNVCYWKIKKDQQFITSSSFYKQILKKDFKFNYTLRTIGTIKKVENSFLH